ncbi:MAG: hypothetical protein DRJ60_02980 [Thermoprotei archaeon]|nr:MAG: hypothetical protein DRJ60_02980 [Thermoprotei archaeon]
MIAIADTCFIIDWSTYRRRDEIFKIFELVLIPEQVLSEVISENTIAWISHALAMGKFHLYTPTPDILNEADSIVRASYSNPQMKNSKSPRLYA